jgi:hypothetical protein
VDPVDSVRPAPGGQPCNEIGPSVALRRWRGRRAVRESKDAGGLPAQPHERHNDGLRAVWNDRVGSSMSLPPASGGGADRAKELVPWV